MKVLTSLGLISIIVACAWAGYFLVGFHKDAPGRIQTLPDPKDILKEQPPSEIFWAVKNGIKIKILPGLSLVNLKSG
jgi:hypothetical protein